MTFWIAFYLFSLFCVAMVFFLPNRYRSVVLYAYLLVIWFIASFRYMIGQDYILYIGWYSELNDINLLSYSEIVESSQELSFILLVKICNYIGLNYQAMFIIIETIIIIFMYKGLKYYLNTSTKILIALVLYVAIRADGTYLWSMNGMRQSMAIAVCFWGSKYYMQKKTIKYLTTIIIAFMLHHSAIFSLLSIPMSKIKWNVKTSILCIVISLSFTLSGISSYIMNYALHNLLFYGVRYMDILTSFELYFQSNIGVGWLLIGIYLGTVLGLKKTESGVCDNRIFNLAVGYLIIRLISSINVVNTYSTLADSINGLFHRVDAYFVIYFIIYVVMSFMNRLHNRKHLIICFLVIMLISATMSIHAYRAMIKESVGLIPGTSINNMNYDVNFDILK